jgi:GNAT superfamily N-acetyltransferase
MSSRTPPRATEYLVGQQPPPLLAQPAGALRLSVRIRRAAPADRRALTEMLARCSDETRRRRFHNAAGAFPDQYLAKALDGSAEHYAIIAELPGRHGSAAGMASCCALTEGVGELALLVEDACQRRGVGKILLEQLRAHADRARLRTLTTTVLAEQDWVIEALRIYGSCAPRLSDGVFQITLLRDPECRPVPVCADFVSVP